MTFDELAKVMTSLMLRHTKAGVLPKCFLLHEDDARVLFGDPTIGERWTFRGVPVQPSGLADAGKPLVVVDR